MAIPIEQFFIAQTAGSAATINRALGTGKNLILTPGIYHLDQSVNVTRPDTVVLGLGFPTLIPDNGIVSLTVASHNPSILSGLLSIPAPFTSPPSLPLA